MLELRRPLLHRGCGLIDEEFGQPALTSCEAHPRTQRVGHSFDRDLEQRLARQPAGYELLDDDRAPPKRIAVGVVAAEVDHPPRKVVDTGGVQTARLERRGELSGQAVALV